MSRKNSGCVALAFLLAAFSAAAQDSDLSDDAIALALEEELQEARAIDANYIDVEVASGVATLQGTVDSRLTLGDG